MPDVVLIRPGCTDFDEQNRIQGSLDLPLNPRGREQVQHVIERLRDRPLEVIYSAPGDPAHSTAVALGEELGVPVKELPGLSNLNHGLWQGLQIDDIRKKYPRVFKQWRESPETIRPPQGETVTEAMDRLRKALHRPLKKKEPIAIVAPEPLATLIRCLIQDVKPEVPEPIAARERDSQLAEFLQTNGTKPASRAGDPQEPPEATRRSQAELSPRGGNSR